MRTRRDIITLCSCNFSVGFSNIHHIFNILKLLYLKTSRFIVHSIWVLLHVLLIQQISHCFKIYFLKSARYLELPAILLEFFHRFKNVVNCSWDQAFEFVIVDVSLHCMSLARACLAIGEDANFEPVKRWSDQFLDFFEDFLLGGVVGENCVEFEAVWDWGVSKAVWFARRAWIYLYWLVAGECKEFFFFLFWIMF